MGRRSGTFPGTGTDAVRRTGATRRQISYWLDTGLFTPVGEADRPGTGRHHTFCGADFEALAVLARLSPLRDPVNGEVRDRVKAIAAHVQMHGAVGTFELLPGVTVDLEVLMASIEEAS